MDLNENIKAMLERSNEATVGSCYIIKCQDLTSKICDTLKPVDLQRSLVSDNEETYSFELASSYLYLFHTQVAFLCLSLSFTQLEALKPICNPGFAYSAAVFQWIDGSGERHPFSMENWLADFCTPLGLHKFFDGLSSFLLDAYAYIFAMVPKRFDTLEEIQKITFNLHKMMPLDALIEDMSEDDIRYVYAVKHQSFNTYRWGCCVASQAISYVVANEAMDWAAETQAQANDGLPVVLLSLYEKYTCLRFTELITHLEKGRIKRLKNLMLKFQAFGTVTPANLSRWHNVKQIYAHLLEVNDIPSNPRHQQQTEHPDRTPAGDRTGTQ